MRARDGRLLSVIYRFLAETYYEFQFNVQKLVWDMSRSDSLSSYLVILYNLYNDPDLKEIRKVGNLSCISARAAYCSKANLYNSKFHLIDHCSFASL